MVGSEQHRKYTLHLRGVWPQRWIYEPCARTSSSELLKSTTSRARKVRRLRLRCQPWSERLITWPWNDSTQARPSACCSIADSYHLPPHLAPSDGLHIEAALASANTKKMLLAVDILCFNYYEACERKKCANSWNDCHPWMECLDSKSGIKKLFGFRACNFQHSSLASWGVLSSCQFVLACPVPTPHAPITWSYHLGAWNGVGTARTPPRAAVMAPRKYFSPPAAPSSGGGPSSQSRAEGQGSTAE
jgi:hypothetical protein